MPGLIEVQFTPKKGYTWTGGGSEAKTVQWTIGRATVATIPTQSGSLTYDGNSKSPTWADYDSSKLTLGGTTSGIQRRKLYRYIYSDGKLPVAG